MSKTITTAFKAALLASTILCIGIWASQNNFEFIIIPLYVISVIITFIIACIMIAITIIPFYELKDNLNAKQKFNRYFPFYAIVYFLVCFSVIFSSNFDIFVSLIFGITYITAMQAWGWFFKQKQLYHEI